MTDQEAQALTGIPVRGVDAMTAAEIDCWHTQAELDRARQLLERRIRRRDRLERSVTTAARAREVIAARRAVDEALRAVHRAEKAAGDAAEAFIATDQ